MAREERSKHTQDNAGSSRPMGCTKAACARDAGGACGHGRSACASVSAAATSTLAAPPPFNPIGAVAWEFVLGIGNIPVVDLTEEALDAEGHTIAPNVCPRTPPRGIMHFTKSHLVPFQGNPPKVWRPERTPNEAAAIYLISRSTTAIGSRI